VTEDHAGLRLAAFFVHVEIAAADGGAGDADDDIVGSFDFRIGDVLDGDGVFSFVDDGFHGSSAARILTGAARRCD